MKVQRCDLCTAKAHVDDLHSHFLAKHDLSRSERNMHVLEEEKIIIYGKEFDVLKRVSRTNVSYYYCTVCKAEGTLEQIEKHVFKWHYQSQEERLMEKEMKLVQKHSKLLYCDICWVIFKCTENSSEYRNHFLSDCHKAKEEYIEETGCDICRTNSDPLLDHFLSIRHHNAKCYVRGEGCDICRRRLSYNSISFHNRLYTYKHDKILNYKKGTGCDICRWNYPFHEKSKEHRRNLYMSQYINRYCITPRTSKVKSARK